MRQPVRAFDLHRIVSRAAALCLLLLSPSNVRPQQLSPEFLHGLQWRLIGPFRGGRVTAVAGISADPKTYYMGTPGGGIWKTSDAGSTWNPIFDQAHVASIGDLVVAPSNPNIIYAATGEQIDGNGVWKSTDAGATWTNIGLTGSRIIPSLLVDPHDANIVYVAAAGEPTPTNSRGIFKSTDGGQRWRKVYFKDDHWSPSELDFDPNDSHTIVATVWHIPVLTGDPPLEGVDNILLKSTDAGETWTLMGEQGLPKEHRGRIGLSIAPGLGGKRIFALMRQGLFRSDDAGATWQKITTDPRILGSNYFGRVYADTKNPNVVYVMQTSTYRSSDGGRTFIAWKGTPSGEDDHVLWIAPEDPNRIIEGTDQGAVITFDCGKSWNTWFNQPTGQFYRVSTDNSFPYLLYAAQQDSGSVVVPTRTDYGLITYHDWFPSGSFESSFIAPDPLNPDHIYSLGWYGNIIRLDHITGQTTTLFISPPTYRESWETPIAFSRKDPHTLYFGSQFLLKTTDNGVTWKEISPDLTAKQPVSSEPPKGSAGGGHVPSKDDREISTLFGDKENEAPQAANHGGYIQAIAPSPVDAKLIWIGTSTGLVHVTHDDGGTWSDVTPSGLQEHLTINCIDASPHDSGIAFAAAFPATRGNVTYAGRDRSPYFFRTRNGGKTWEKIVTGLPEEGIARTIREDTVRKGMLFAGTETGVFVSFDFGDHWQPLPLNLPTSSVRDLAIHGDDLIAATFGRGLWVLDDISPLRQIVESPATPAKQAVQFFTPQTAIRAHWDNHPDTPLQPGTPAAQNPPDGAILYYSLGTVPKGEITLDVLDEKGTRIRRFSSLPSNESLPPANVPEIWFAPPDILPNSVGLHRFVWDLRYRHPAALPYGFFGERLQYTEYTLPDHAVPGQTPRFQPPGPLVSPGTYQLVLTIDGKSYRQSLRVVPDPRVHLTSADYAAQFDLSRKIYELMNGSAAYFDSLSPLQSQLDERKKALASEPNKELTDAIADMEKQLDTLESGNNQAPGFGTLNRNLGRYMVMVQAGDIAPTESSREAFRGSCDAFVKNVAAVKKLTADTIPSLNQSLASQRLAPLAYKPLSDYLPACTP